MHDFLRLPLITLALTFLPVLGCSGSGGSHLEIEDASLPLYSPVREVSSSAGGSIAPSGSELRVMSFNLRVQTIFDGLNHWRFRRQMLLQTIRWFDPDLLGTQEALSAQADYLRQRLPDYEFVGAGRSNGKRRGEMCGIFYRSDRFELIDAGHFWLSKSPEKPGSKSWGAMFPRMVSWVKLRPRSGGQTFCFFNTHFDNIGSRARLESARLLREKVHTIAGGMPTIVTGDFNTDERTAPYNVLVDAPAGGVRFADTFRLANPRDVEGNGTRHGFDGVTRGPRIDWILTSEGFQTLAASILRTRRGIRYPSDHFPVTAILRPLRQAPVATIE